MMLNSVVILEVEEFNFPAFKTSQYNQVQLLNNFNNTDYNSVSLSRKCKAYVYISIYFPKLSFFFPEKHFNHWLDVICLISRLKSIRKTRFFRNDTCIFSISDQFWLMSFTVFCWDSQLNHMRSNKLLKKMINATRQPAGYPEEHLTPSCSYHVTSVEILLGVSCLRLPPHFFLSPFISATCPCLLCIFKPSFLLCLC